MVNMNFDDQELNLKPGLERYIADALEVVRMKFVDDASLADNAETYPVEFAYQQFGDAEKIFGYKDLQVSLTYTDLTMYSYLNINHKGLSTKVDKDVMPDDIRKKVLELYPIDQQDCLVDKWSLFEDQCRRQKEFKPFGDKIDEFSMGNRKFVLYKVLDNTPDFDAYMCRIQTLTMWFIESAQYTDNTDPRFMHYLLFEECADFKSNPLKLAAYMTLYRYYAYPDLERARFAHVLVLPPYRKSGLGPKFLGAVYADIRNSPRIVDATAETPAESFTLMRDYVDCVTCKELPEFSLETLKKGFNKELAERVRKQYKICKTQCRRVYEILYNYYVKTECPEEKKAFDSLVKKRLERPFKHSKRDTSKIVNALEENELAVIATNEQQRDRDIEALFEETLGQYDAVISRLVKYEPLFGGQQ